MVSVEPDRHHERVPILGLGVDRIRMDQAIETIEEFIRAGSPHHVITLDASMCVIAHDDPDLAEIARNAELVTPDGAGILWACRKFGTPLPERVSGVDIVERLCALSPSSGHSLFFFGSAPGVADAAAERMHKRYPGCRIAGTRDGFFNTSDEGAIVDLIRSARPDILLVALGIPKQEKWIARHRASLGVPVMIGVGGSFDVHSGRVKRAPRWVQRLNIEWLYRLAKNPRKLSKVLTLPKFVVMTLKSNR